MKNWLKFIFSFLLSAFLLVPLISAESEIVTVEIPDTSLYLEGYTCPLCMVTIKENGVVIGTTVSDANGLFIKEIFALPFGTHHIEIYSSDPLNNLTNTINIPLILIPNQTTVFTNIYLPPTIILNQNYFIGNQDIIIYGYAAPNSPVQVTIIGDSFYRYTIISDLNGKYLISFPSSNFPNADYSTYANLVINGIIDNSTQSKILFFTINGVFTSVTPTTPVVISQSVAPTITSTIMQSLIPTTTPKITVTIEPEPIVSYDLFLRCLYFSIPFVFFIYLIFLFILKKRNPHIYILGGPGKSGTSYISSRILKDFKFDFLYIGSILKRKAIRAGFVKGNYIIPESIDEWDLDKADIKAFRDFCELTNRNVDREIDGILVRKLIEVVDKKSRILIDSKILSLFMFTTSFRDLLRDELNKIQKGDQFNFYFDQIHKNSYSIWLHTSLEVRAKRSLLKNKLTTNLSEDEIRKEMINLSKRQISDKLDYIKKYNLIGYPEPNGTPKDFKGVIIDNTNLNGDETYKVVKKAFKLKDS